MAAPMRSEGGEDFVDYYYTLGLPPDASTDSIEARYWRLAREYRADPAAAPKLEELNEARRVLASRRLRQQYDERRDAVLGPGAPPRPPTRGRERAPLRVVEKLLPGLHEHEPPLPHPHHSPEPEPEPRWLRVSGFVVLGLMALLLAVYTVVLWLTGVIA